MSRLSRVGFDENEKTATLPERVNILFIYFAGKPEYPGIDLNVHGILVF